MAEAVIGLIGSVISIVEGTTSTVNIIKKIKDLPKAFHEVEKNLPIAKHILEETSRELKNASSTIDSSNRKALQEIVKECRSRAEKLDEITREIKEGCGAGDQVKDVSWMTFKGTYRNIIDSKKNLRIETLMRDLMRDIETLVSEKIFRQASCRDEVLREVERAIQGLELVATENPSIEDKELDPSSRSNTQQNYGNSRGYMDASYTTGGVKYVTLGDSNFHNHPQDISTTYLRHLYENPPNPLNDKTRIEKKNGGLITGVHQWIFDEPIFIQWYYKDDARLLWIQGGMGKGKTMLVCRIIDNLASVAYDPHADSVGTNLVYYFCEDDRHDDFAAVVRGLLLSLFAQQPDIRKDVIENNKAQPPLNLKERYALGMLARDVFRNSKLKPTIVIIDALDECKEGLDDLLDFVTQNATGRVKFLVSSRHKELITDKLGFSQHPRRESDLKGGSLISLESHAQLVNDSIRVYIEKQTEELFAIVSDRVVRKLAKRYLVDNAGGTFLWISLVLKAIAPKGRLNVLPSRIIERLHDFPPDLQRAYERVWKEMLGEIPSPEDDQDLESATRREFCPQILALVAQAREPVLVGELAVLMEAPQNKDEREMVVACGRPFLSTTGSGDDAEIHFVHLSVKQFLVDNDLTRGILFPRGVAMFHLDIARRSIHALSDRFARLRPPTRRGRQFIRDSTDSGDPLRYHTYSSLHCIWHLVTGVSAPEVEYPALKSILVNVDAFMRIHLLEWLEHFAQLKKLSVGYEVLVDLEGYLLTDEPRDILHSRTPSLMQIAADARDAIQDHKLSLHIDPSEVYSTLLLFSHEDSAIRALYHDRHVAWATSSLCSLGGLQMNPVIVSAFKALIFFPDSERVFGRNHDCYCIRACDTGQLLLKMDNSMLPMTLRREHLSPDGTRLIGFSGSTIVVWCTDTGRVVNETSVSPEIIRFTIFSKDEKAVFIGTAKHTSNAKALWKWDLQSNRRTSVTTSRLPTSIFLIDNTRVLFKANRAATFLSLETGACEDSIAWNASSDNILDVTNPPDVSFLLLLEIKRPTHVQDVAKDLIDVLRSCRDWLDPGVQGDIPRSMQNGSQLRATLPEVGQNPSDEVLVSATTWNPQSDPLGAVTTLEKTATQGWRDAIPACHGKLLILTDNPDHQAKVWDVRSKRMLGSLVHAHQGNQFLMVQQHPRESIVAASNEDGDVRLWNLSTLQCTALVQGYHEQVALMNFSPCGTLLATYYLKQMNRTKIWEIARMQAPSLNSHKVGFLDVSPSGDHMCLLLATETGYQTMVRGTHAAATPAQVFLGQQYADSIAFSPNSQLVACLFGGVENAKRRLDFRVFSMRAYLPHRPIINIALDEREVSRLKQPDRKPTIYFSEDSKRVIACGWSKFAVCDIDLGHCSWLPDVRDVPSIISCTPDARLLFCGIPSADLEFCVLDTVNRQLSTKPFRAFRRAYNGVEVIPYLMRVSPDGKYLFLATKLFCGIWDASDGTYKWHHPSVRGEHIQRAAFAHGGDSIALITEKPVTEVRSTEDGSLQFVIPERYLYGRLALASRDGLLEISDLLEACSSPEPIKGKEQWFSIIWREAYTHKPRYWICRNGKALLGLPSGMQIRQWEVRGCRLVILTSASNIVTLTFDEHDHAYPADKQGVFEILGSQDEGGQCRVSFRNDEDVGEEIQADNYMVHREVQWASNEFVRSLVG